MAQANLVTRLSLDTSKFSAGMARAGAMVRAMGASMAKLGGLLSQAAAKMKVLGFAAFGVGAGMAFGIKKALDLGGRLSDVAAQTGLSVKSIALWEEAMRQGGMEAEAFRGVANKLQKSIFDLGHAAPNSALAKSFSLLGLDRDALRGMDPGRQFEVVMERLEGIEDQADKAGAAMSLLGRSGAKLFAVTAGGKSSIELARQALGGQADILDRQAAAFDRISDIIGGIGVKVRGFFVGVADTLLPILSKMAEAWDKMDFSGFGRQVGQWMGDLIKNWKRLPELLWEGLKVVIAKLISLLLEGFKLAGAYLLNVATHMGQFIGDTIKEAIMPGKQDVKSMADRLKDSKAGPLSFTLDADKALENYKRLLGEIFTKVGPAAIGAGAAMREVGPGPEDKAKVRGSMLDWVIGKRNERRAQGLTAAQMGGFNPGTDRASGGRENRVFGGKGFIGDQFAANPLKMFADKLDIFARPPGGEAREQVKLREMKKTEEEKHTALLTQQVKDGEKVSAMIERIALSVIGTKDALLETLGPLN